MLKALKFVLFWLGTWVAYCLIYGAIYTYDALKGYQRHTFGRSTSGPLGLPQLWELAIVAVVCGVAGFFTALKFIRSEPPAGRGEAKRGRRR